MRLVEIGRHLRLQRHAHGMTQQDLATRAGVTRSTVSRIESGADNDIGVKKLAALLEAVGSSLGVEPLGRPIEEDPIATIARAAGGPVFGTLYPDELVQAILTGQPAPHKAALVQIAVEELTPPTRRALIEQVGRLIDNPLKADAGLRRLERNLGTERPGHALDEEGRGGALSDPAPAVYDATSRY